MLVSFTVSGIGKRGRHVLYHALREHTALYSIHTEKCFYTQKIELEKMESALVITRVSTNAMVCWDDCCP